jgi:hypothetical protein
MPTTALQYFERIHGKATDFLSKDAIVALLNGYADVRFDEFKAAKKDFQTEQWTSTTNSRIGKSHQSPDFPIVKPPSSKSG